MTAKILLVASSILVLSGKPPASLVSTLFAQNTSNTDGWSVAPATFAQKIHNTTGAAQTISQVKCYMSANSTQNVTVGIWSAPDATGTQYGANSIATSVTTADAEYVFDWSVNPVGPSGDYYIVFTMGGGTSEGNIATDTGGTGYDTTAYNAYRGATVMATSDLVFKLYTMQ